MTADESEQLQHIFRNLDENDGRPDPEVLDALIRLSPAGKAEFVRWMDERYGIRHASH